jgi:hypothetical protein
MELGVKSRFGDAQAALFRTDDNWVVRTKCIRLRLLSNHGVRRFRVSVAIPARHPRQRAYRERYAVLALRLGMDAQDWAGRRGRFGDPVRRSGATMMAPIALIVALILAALR